MEAATALIEKLEGLRENFSEDKPMLEHLRQSVQQIKNELDVLAASDRVGQNLLAREVGQWLTIWLQNPQIFPEWLALRRNTPEFRTSFGEYFCFIVLTGLKTDLQHSGTFPAFYANTNDQRAQLAR